jgi:carboxyl-terminal processing protease
MRRLVLVALLVCSLVAPVRGRLVPAAAQQGTAVGIDTVGAAYNDLLDLFFRQPDPRDLLTAGWYALTLARRRAGQTPPAALPALPDGRGPAFTAFADAYRSFVAGLAADDERRQAAFSIVEGMAQSLRDQHTAFLPPDIYRSALVGLAGDKPIGPGFHFVPRVPLVVSAVAPGGPAEQAGMQPGDTIVALDGKSLAALTPDDLLRDLVAPPAGATVVYGVTRDGQRLDIPIVSGPYYFPVLESRLLPGGTGYLRLDEFVAPFSPLPDGTIFLDDFDSRLDELDAQGATELILDLRGNQGGSVETALELLGRFLPEDTLVVDQRDDRGHESQAIVAGQMRAVQHPLLVLVDRGSASASELVAATLREQNRALIAGERTLGALTSSSFLELPEGAGLQLALADVFTAYNHAHIDGTGVSVDVSLPDTRSGADFRAGRDPQLDGAVKSLPLAPAPPTSVTAGDVLPNDRLRGLLAGYIPDPAQIPTNARLASVQKTSSADLDHANEVVSFGSRDPQALLHTVEGRGWLGTHTQNYGVSKVQPPEISVSASLFATPAGAAAMVAANDAPDLLQPMTAPVQLGDATAAYRGTWFGTGTVELIWQRDNVVFAVSYSDTPGQPAQIDTLVAVAKLVDAAYARNPLSAAAIGMPTARTGGIANRGSLEERLPAALALVAVLSAAGGVALRLGGAAAR